MKRPSYRAAVAWVVNNDDTEVPESMPDPVDYLSGLISIALVADLFGKSSTDVALDVLKYSATLAEVGERTHRCTECGSPHTINTNPEWSVCLDCSWRFRREHAAPLAAAR